MSDRRFRELVVNIPIYSGTHLKSSAFKIIHVTEYAALFSLMVPLKGFAVQIIFFLQGTTSNHTKGNYF